LPALTEQVKTPATGTTGKMRKATA
jgi:hypothetical protein